MTDGSMALQEKQCRVITIEATEKPQDIKLRVAAYARVSSASDDQLNSFAAQNRYYTALISGNMRWSYQNRMVDGTFLPSSLPYGYAFRDHKIVINEEQAEVVRKIFLDYLSGINMTSIAESLNLAAVPKRANRSAKAGHKRAKWGGKVTAKVRDAAHNRSVVGCNSPPATKYSK